MKSYILLPIIALAFLSCKKSGDSSKDADMTSLDTVRTEAEIRADAENLETGSPEQNAYAEFSTSGGAIPLRLREGESAINIQALGIPNDTLTRVMTLATDKHQGATVKEYKYDDVHLQLLRPKGGTHYWLSAITITGGPWSTARGIKVGDSLQDVMNMYPKATRVNTGLTDIYRYMVDNSEIDFFITDNKVSKIEMRNNLPS